MLANINPRKINIDDINESFSQIPIHMKAYKAYGLCKNESFDASFHH